MFNPVASYGYLLSTVYLFMADIANLNLFVCGSGFTRVREKSGKILFPQGQGKVREF